MTLDHVAALDDDLVGGRIETQHLAGASAVLAGQQHDLVVAADACGHG
jgi:hypothetical protein